MTIRTQPIYQQLVDAVIAREKGRGVTTMPGSRETSIRACLASTDYSLYYASRGAAKFGLDLCLRHDGEEHEGLPAIEESRRGLELVALVLADIKARERGSKGPGPEGGSPAFAGSIDDYLVDLSHLGSHGPDRNPDPGGPASAWPFEYKRAA